MYKIIESTVHNGHLLHRIEAMCFGNFIIVAGLRVKATWVAAMVYDDAVAKVYGYAKVGDKAIVRDHAKVFGNARVIGEAIVSDEAVICHYYGICYC